MVPGSLLRGVVYLFLLTFWTPFVGLLMLMLLSCCA